MNKDKERLGLKDLLAFLKGWSIVPRSREESPDFVIMNDVTKKRIGVEVTNYYPHRSKKGNALVQVSGKDLEESNKNNHRFFSETELGYFRFVPKLDVNDFYRNRIIEKEEKLELYKKNEPDCQEFWLLVMLDFYDNIVYEDAPVIPTKFDKIYVWEEPHTIRELSIKTCRL